MLLEAHLSWDAAPLQMGRSSRAQVHQADPVGLSQVADLQDPASPPASLSAAFLDESLFAATAPDSTQQHATALLHSQQPMVIPSPVTAASTPEATVSPGPPTSPAAFAQALRKPLGDSILQPPLPPRRPRNRAPPAASPCRSNRLARKALHRTPSLLAAQNILMHKMGLSGHSQLESSDFDRYVKIFKNGLSEEQVKQIRELFSSSVPAPVEADAEGVV
ncbi:hypothetical protein BAE44_0021611 [Dichanthelium oligosanthes]|uniref:Uncharacterized protein n=1 Tax=Dichanthelium oligosanthes TaxID=888268 RepID=A0A1E5UWY8_9POAL|nr:hypothetical protein BAE44_0021611 [Dichanthelium oligosanthes]